MDATTNTAAETPADELPYTIEDCRHFAGLLAAKFRSAKVWEPRENPREVRVYVKYQGVKGDAYFRVYVSATADGVLCDVCGEMTNTARRDLKAVWTAL